MRIALARKFIPLLGLAVACIAPLHSAMGDGPQSINYTKEAGPVRDQIGGTCYAHAAAEMLSFHYRQSYPRGFSPYDIAARYGEYQVAWAMRYHVPPQYDMRYQKLVGADGGDQSLGVKVEYGAPFTFWPEWLGLCRSERLETTSASSVTWIYFVAKQLLYGSTFSESIYKVRHPSYRYRETFNELKAKRLYFRFQDLFRSLDEATDESNRGTFYKWCKQKLGNEFQNCSYVARTLKKMFEENFFPGQSEDEFLNNFIAAARMVEPTVNSYIHLHPEVFFGNPKIRSQAEGEIASVFNRMILNNFCGTYEKPLPHYKDIATLYWDESMSPRSWERSASEFIEHHLKSGHLVSVGFVSDGTVLPARTKPLMKGDSYHHASVLIGFQTFNGEKYYLGKNSWGQSTVPKRGTYALPVKSADGKVLPGYFWLPKHIIAQHPPFIEETVYVYQLSSITGKKWLPSSERGGGGGHSRLSDGNKGGGNSNVGTYESEVDKERSELSSSDNSPSDGY